MMAVSQSLLIDPDFIPIRAALVRELGAMEAIVWQLIYFRTAERSPHRYEQEGQSWWRANREELALASGLSPDQVKRVIAKLEKSGHLVAAEHRDGGITDRTKSYHCVTDESAQSIGANPPSQERGDSAHSSSKKSEEGVSTSNSPPSDGSALSELFEEAWKHWPKKDARKPAFEKFQLLIRDRVMSAEDLAAAIVRHGDAYAASGRDVQFVPGLRPWLHQRRWSDDLARPATTQPKQTAFRRNLSTVEYFAQEAQHEQARALEAAHHVLPR
ncbi:hypothetical protein Csp2054_09015 [Curtobacterium sp. 'Ferrero']|uniref:hypothetical protein n=1 Tax=Curtobacterium sp. 'Ferrero' TaxID=2033654 RepID=UPI000BDC3887|nr:hypothetical protein [Curtobacterium sp. 'Ferrero']PCN48003.1 hypothetical protein Csp2054_09015 [Curtobacterium sp. 'Ferrero']